MYADFSETSERSMPEGKPAPTVDLIEELTRIRQMRCRTAPDW
jgi:hypothetical protein